MKLKLRNYFYRIFKWSSALLLYLKARKNSPVIKPGEKEKIVVIRISNPKIFGRYLYTFIKFFSLQGYTIYLPGVNFKIFRNKFYVREAKAHLYFNLIFKEGLITLGEPPIGGGSYLTFGDHSISYDYFEPFFDDRPSSVFLPIPMAMHPLFYYKNLWNQPIINTERKKNSVFMIGNFDEQYNQFNEELFGMESRLTAVSFLKKKGILSKINSENELNDFLESTREKECIIINRDDFAIEMKNLRSVLSQFPFFLALPGVNIPHCHNIVEAMSVGSIPIIHQNYAVLWKPELKHLETAIVYYNLDDLYDKLKIVFNFEESEVERMHLNVLKYYNDNLTPAGVVNKLEKNIYYPIFLQAEHHSIARIESDITLSLIHI